MGAAFVRRPLSVLALAVLMPACGDSDSPEDPQGNTGGAAFGSGGAPSTGGAIGAGGSGSGGDVGSGGVGSGGDAGGSGGTPAGSGGAPGAGGSLDGAGGAPSGAGGEPAVPPEDFEATAADFECVQRWDKVRNFRITNKLGKLDEALAVANSPSGGRYPVGTIIQLVPIEAMVKRREGFSPETNDWEFFFLDVTAAGAQITTRGTTNVVNQFGGNCFTCHSAAEPQWDFVCETGHGCAPLPLPTAVLVALQDTDPRCP